MAVAASGDDLYLGRLFASIVDDELQLVATWWGEYMGHDVLLTAVVDVREVGN